MAVAKSDGRSLSPVQTRVRKETLVSQRLGSANADTSRIMEGTTKHSLEMQGGAGKVNASVVDGTKVKEMEASLEKVSISSGSMKPQTTGELGKVADASAA
tara:strand:- start:5824 stop:6126 length:303 start_codon:yes stop_codon:yes gene_type:complete